MTRAYVVCMPRAEARHLAGVSPSPWPATPEARAIQAVREWVTGISRRRSATVPAAKVVADLTAILGILPARTRPACGPFAPPGNGTPALAGQVEYLGNGVVRLDEEAITSLAQLPEDHDFHASLTDAGPVLSVGPDTYLARGEQPTPPPRPPAAPATP